MQSSARQPILGESLVLAGTRPAALCCDCVEAGSVTLRGAYREGRDYVVDYARGTLARTPDSRIPDYAAHPAFGRADFDHTRLADVTNHPYFVWVDYTTTNAPVLAEPNDQRQPLAAIRARLDAGGPFRLVSYGDSITAGNEASAPELRFVNRYALELERRFPRVRITVEDVSIPGYTSSVAIARWDEFVGRTTPDLVLLGWGMNDHNNVDGNEPAVFRANLVTLVGMVRACKGATAVLYSAFPPHEDWHYGTHRMAQYAEMTRLAARETGCAYADVWDTWQRVLRRKDQSSLLGNNINHPNDFGHWLYFKAFEAMAF